MKASVNTALQRSSRFLTSVLCLLAVMICRDGVAGLVISDGEKSNCRIVVSTNAGPCELYAAEELRDYLKRMSGAELPIVKTSGRSSSNEIIVCEASRLKEAGQPANEFLLGPDDFILRTDGKRLVIAGGGPRGTLYGVYSLLEEKLGVRWFAPDCEVVPQRRRVEIPELNETHVPRLEYREVFWSGMLQNADFAARLRLNGQHYALTEKHGGRAQVYHPFVHSFESLIPPGLFKEHPEYFPLINGERRGGYVQRCLSNPDVVKLAIARVREWLRERPQITIVSVSQNDTANYCQCESCKTLDEAEGTPASSLLRFVNAIAEDIERDHPRVRIDTLAYQYTRRPPKTIRPRHNVIIRLCSIECCFAHPLETCDSEANRRFRDDILAWEKVAPVLYVWDYTPNFAHYQQPFPNFDALQPNVRFFVEHRVKGLFEQGNYSPGGHGEMEPLRAYLLAKLVWNPDTDVDRHTREFLDAYYGKAAPGIRAYLEMIHRPVRQEGMHAHIYDPPKAAYLKPKLLTEAERVLDEAEQQAGNETIRFRVQLARLPVWYVKLATKRVEGEARDDLLARFLEIARKAGISHISEGRTLDDWAKQMQAN